AAGPGVVVRQLLADEGHDVVDVDAEARDGPHEAGVTEGEYASVGSHHPVAEAVVGGHDTHHVGDVDVDPQASCYHQLPGAASATSGASNGQAIFLPRLRGITNKRCY